MENSRNVLSAGLEFFFAIVSVILLIGYLLDRNRKIRINRVMIVILALHAIMNIADACIWLWCDAPGLLPLMKALTFVSYALGYSIFSLFSWLMVLYIREYARVPGYVPAVIAMWSAFVMVMLIIFASNGMYYYWDENGIYQKGELYHLGDIFGVIIILFSIALVSAYRKALKKRDYAVFVLYNAIPLAGYAFPFWDIVPFYMASTISLLLYFIVIHLDNGRMVAEQQARIAKQELALSEGRTAIMLSQIQPHFLYNSLTAIAQLCEKDPKKAKEVTLRFSEYLRLNMSSLDQKAPIPFENELEHVKTYLYIEQVRFGEKLRVSYDIETTHFYIPSLCLQPIVENAVKHGVCVKEEGGLVTIRVRDLPDHIEISVSDDGVGFDTQDAPVDGKSHIGLINARTRLEAIIGATLEVETEKGVGTTVYINISKGNTMEY